MSDSTPADVIAAAFSVGRGVTNSPEALAARVLDALATAGYRVTPIPDDNTRALAARLYRWANGQPRGLADDLRAAAVLLREQAERLQDSWYTDIGERLDAVTAERDEARRQLDTLRNAIGDPDELRWHRWHCEATGSGDDLRELLVRIADAVDALAAAGGGVPEEGA